jgi:hypothetical protein
MCAIVASRNINVLKDLVSLNSYRGSESYSYSWFNIYTSSLVIVDRGFGTFDINKIVLPTDCYGIVHVQAPTNNEGKISTIHPAVIMNQPFPEYTPDYALWHNGIIKSDVVDRYAEETGTRWDTMQILNKISKSDGKWWNRLNDFDGTFSCLLYHRSKGLFIFRNQISPMFVDVNMNISSTKFEGSQQTTPDIVWKIDPLNHIMSEVGTFKTVENPYYFGE